MKIQVGLLSNQSNQIKYYIVIDTVTGRWLFHTSFHHCTYNAYHDDAVW